MKGHFIDAPVKGLTYRTSIDVGVTGDPDQILKLTRQIGIIYGKTGGSGADDYLVDHSAAIILFDPTGSFHALFGVPHQPELIASDFLAIRDYYEAVR